MLIVAGHLTVTPQQRGPYLAGCVPVVEQARRTPGCLDYALSADPVDLGRINVFERWQTRADLDGFRAGGPDDAQAAVILAAAIAEYEVSIST